MPRPRLTLALVFVFGSFGLGASCRQGRASTSNPSASDGGVATTTTTASNSNVTQVDGVDLTPLSASERESFWAIANEELSPCGDPYSIAACASEHRPCRTCLPALKFLARRIQDGVSRDAASELLRARFSRDTVVTVHTGDAPSRGPADAAVTVVEFSDYECPHCRHAMPILREIEREFTGRIRIVHMDFPLGGHPHAMAAARAALAAGRQGKFWEMHEKLFENQRALETADIDRYAREVGLDLARFHTDIASPEIEAAIQRTRHEGERLQLQGTPTIYINGRRYDLPVERAPLHEWVQDELDALGTARGH